MQLYKIRILYNSGYKDKLKMLQIWVLAKILHQSLNTVNIG